MDKGNNRDERREEQWSLLFVNENNASIGVEENRCFVKYSDGMKKIVPIETLESITIMGRAQMTT